MSFSVREYVSVDSTQFVVSDLAWLNTSPDLNSSNSLEHSCSCPSNWSYRICQVCRWTTIDMNMKAISGGCSLLKMNVTTRRESSTCIDVNNCFVCPLVDIKSDRFNSVCELTKKEKSRLNDQFSSKRSIDIPLWWDTIQENVNDIRIMSLMISFISKIKCSKVQHHWR